MTHRHRKQFPEPGLPWDIACIFKLKLANEDFTDEDFVRATEYGEALLLNSVRPAAYVAMTNGATIQFFRVTLSDSRTYAYLASDPLPISAPIAKSLLYFMLTSDPLPELAPLFLDEATILIRGLSLPNPFFTPLWFFLFQVKLRDSYLHNEKQALDALATVAPHVPVVLAASSSTLILTPLGKPIKLIDGLLFPQELGTGFVTVLQRIHALGWCHRDLRPSNLLQTEDGQPLLIDFGFARESGSEVLMEGDPLYAADRLLRLRLEEDAETDHYRGAAYWRETGTYHATPQDDCEALVKVIYPMPSVTRLYLQCFHRGDTAEYLRYWRQMANDLVPFKEALAAARKDPIDYDALRRACDSLLERVRVPPSTLDPGITPS
ncbi:hypothetical protein PAPYR_6731 [Paratrimastix pyriformis]|uniref:Protein kinase domain-containing protein n=1 Tax=Paratrimastix pyriformis TaxID=342808 RepID=A0ABQ8UH36_9EUKA|nr:hypothetical protein PAPYR_6731 [Paratrimastix pyriformis]